MYELSKVLKQDAALPFVLLIAQVFLNEMYASSAKVQFLFFYFMKHIPSSLKFNILIILLTRSS